MPGPFEIGQVVALRADDARRGPVVEVLAPVSGVRRYRVFHSPDDVREYLEDQLRLIDGPQGPEALIHALTTGQGVPAEEFIARVTAARLDNSLIDSLYSLHAARIDFVPFQFKPVLRLLRSDQPRLLIADEVGVGKTIEAALVFCELAARQHVENVLVVCPKALVQKWRSEFRRFDQDFQILNSDRLLYCLRETNLEGMWPEAYSRAIVPLEVVRMETHLFGNDRTRSPGLEGLDPPPAFDLLIVDEAHHLRNPDTLSHEAGRFLCTLSQAVVFLSATPVHLGSENLFALVHLLRPDMFPNLAVFEQMVAPHRYLHQAMRHIRSAAPADEWQSSALAALNSAAATDWGARTLPLDPRFNDWRERLSSSPLSEDDRIRCLRELEEVHSLSNVVNRTRRRDIGAFTLRDPRTVSVPFSPEQRAFYDAVLRFKTELLLLDHSAQVARLVIDTIERQVSSCLPALVPLLDGFINTGRFVPVSHAEGDDDDAEFVLPEHLVALASNLRGFATELPSRDDKLDAFLTIVKESVTGNGPRKVLVFSFFLHTLSYLERELTSRGYRVGLITGRLPDEEREELRSRFSEPHDNDSTIDVLLSSEVGCEGLDYQFCDRLVNYDIPWNPMRIEQRIGRIDRYGQKSPKVLIYNFVTPDTVEERIFFRCWERIGIFRDVVGDLEEILGEVVQELNRLSLDATLTPEQAAERALTTSDNALRILEEQRRLEEQGGQLLGTDQLFLEDVRTLTNEGRYPAPAEIHNLLRLYLRRLEPNAAIAAFSASSDIFDLKLSDAGKQSLGKALRQLGTSSPSGIQLKAWIDGSRSRYLATFSQSTARDRREIAFITPVHPLTRLAVRAFSDQSRPFVAHVRISDPELRPGRYVFALDLWEVVGARPELRLVSCVVDLDKQTHHPELDQVLVSRFCEIRDSTDNAPSNAVRTAVEHLDETAHRARRERLAAVTAGNEALLSQRQASVDAFHANRCNRIEEQLAQATNERIVRMKRAELKRAEHEYSEQCDALSKARVVDIVTKRIAIGRLEIEACADGNQLRANRSR